MSNVLSAKRVGRWVRELKELWEGRRSPGLFAAVSTLNGVRYVTLPDQIWATKSHEFWVFLSVLLHRVKPESILELGSGRSSIYLSEYASKQKKCFVSVDENEKWSVANRLIAQFGGLETDYFHYIPLDSNGYYEESAVINLIHQKPDFVYMDGPIKDRSGILQQERTLSFCERADVIIIDDIQWRSVYDQMDIFKSKGKTRVGTILSYETPKRTQYLSVLVRSDLQPVIDEILQVLKINSVKHYTREECIRN